MPIHSRRELEQIFAETAQDVGQDITIKQFTRLAGIPESQIYKFYGSFNDLRKAVGLDPSRHARRRFSNDDVLEAFHRVVYELKRLPSVSEFVHHTGHGDSILYRRFGNMKNVIAAWKDWMKRNFRPGEEPAEPLHRKNPQKSAQDDEAVFHWMREAWFNLRVAFEPRTSDFRGRPDDACDLLIVLDHDWPTCPVPVLEFAQVLKKPTILD